MRIGDVSRLGSFFFLCTEVWTENYERLSLNQEEDRVQWAADFLDSRGLQLASLPLRSVSATASLPIDYKGFLLSGDSHSMIIISWWSMFVCVCVCYGFIVHIAH